MRPDRDRGDAELLSAYVDGVSELSLDERKRVDDLLARDPVLRADESATRDLIHQLRDLPPAGGEPDWSALERSIGETINALPAPWWQRLRWRFVVPSVALAMGAAVFVFVVHAPKPELTPDLPLATIPVETTTEAPDIASSIPLWLDGTDLEVALEAAELFDLEWDLDEDSVPETAELLPPTDLEWVDDLDTDSLERAEQFLDRPHKGRT